MEKISYERCVYESVDDIRAYLTLWLKKFGGKGIRAQNGLSNTMAFIIVSYLLLSVMGSI